MFTPLLAGLATFCVWFLVVIVAFLFLGMCTARILARVLPEGQERLPRWMGSMACIGISVLAGATAGVQVGVVRGALAIGDTVVAGRMVMSIPFVSRHTARSNSPRSTKAVTQALEEEAKEILQGGMIRYAIGHLALGNLYEPVVTAWEFGRAYARNQGMKKGWPAVRNDLEEVAVRKTALSLLGGIVYVIGAVFLGLAFVALSWRDIQRGWRPSPPS